jgi:hypothetical protein
MKMGKFEDFDLDLKEDRVVQMSASNTIVNASLKVCTKIADKVTYSVAFKCSKPLSCTGKCGGPPKNNVTKISKCLGIK